MTLKISGDFFQLLTSKQYQIFGKNSPLLELIPIKMISNIEHSIEEHEININYVVGESKVVTIRSPSSLQIIEVKSSS